MGELRGRHTVNTNILGEMTIILYCILWCFGWKPFYNSNAIIWKAWRPLAANCITTVFIKYHYNISNTNTKLSVVLQLTQYQTDYNQDTVKIHGFISFLRRQSRTCKSSLFSVKCLIQKMHKFTYLQLDLSIQRMIPTPLGKVALGTDF